MKPEKLWTKDFVVLSITNFFVSLVFYLLMTLMTVYAVEQFRASESVAGLASSIFVIGAVFSRLFAGKYVEVIGRKRMLYGSLILFLISSLSYIWVQDLSLLLVLRLIHGMAFGIANNAMSTAVMDLIPAARRGEGTGYYTLSATGSTAIGPFLGLFISQQAGFDMVFIACTLFAVVSIAATLFVNIPEADLTKEQKLAIRSGFSIDDFFEPKAVPISIIMIIMGIGYSGVISFLNSFAIEAGVESAASFFFIVYAVFLFISRPLGGKLLDQKGDNFVIYPALICFAASLLLIGFANHGIVLLIAGVLLAFGFGTVMSCAQAIAVKVSPRHRVALATSTFYICTDSGMGIGPFLLGMIIPFVGYQGMYLTLTVVIVLSISLYYVLHGKKASSLQKELAAKKAGQY